MGMGVIRYLVVDNACPMVMFELRMLVLWVSVRLLDLAISYPWDQFRCVQAGIIKLMHCVLFMWLSAGLCTNYVQLYMCVWVKRFLGCRLHVVCVCVSTRPPICTGAAKWERGSLLLDLAFILLNAARAERLPLLPSTTNACHAPRQVAHFKERKKIWCDKNTRFMLNKLYIVH